MDFREVSQISAFLAKNYAEDLFKLLVKYRDISASQAASRLELHVKTTQHFLEGLNALGIVEKKEVYEKKRPYFRYKLKKRKLTIDIDLSSLYDPEVEKKKLRHGIRERKDSGAILSTSGSGNSISTVTISTGKGRNLKERRIRLTSCQGKFLYHLPLPGADAMSITKIMEKSDIDVSCIPEILDIVEVLEEYGVIEIRG